MIYKYNKLVRDKIPEEINKIEGTKASYKILNDNEYIQELFVKKKTIIDLKKEYIALVNGIIETNHGIIRRAMAHGGGVAHTCIAYIEDNFIHRIMQQQGCWNIAPFVREKGIKAFISFSLSQMSFKAAD